MRQYITTGPSSTQNLGERIGEKLNPGSAIALMGDLGCGKTCFTKGLCAGLGISKKEVNSPSFTLANEYKGRLPVFHLDLYRIEDLDATLDMGISDYLERLDSGVLIVEWAEKILPLLPESRLEVNFSVLSSRKRQIVFTAYGESLNKLLSELNSDSSGN